MKVFGSRGINQPEKRHFQGAISAECSELLNSSYNAMLKIPFESFTKTIW